jgi:hypothetical protein
VPLPAAFVERLQALPNNLFAKFQVRTSTSTIPLRRRCAVTSPGEDMAD